MFLRVLYAFNTSRMYNSIYIYSIQQNKTFKRSTKIIRIQQISIYFTDRNTRSINFKEYFDKFEEEILVFYKEKN